jgi:2-polyprenyl-3-methyl-5-hydroxy-6-metoxy-1,4-benzoquinol methylase
MSIDRRYYQTEDPFVAEDLQQMKLAPKYNEWIFQLIKPYLGKKVIEVGSGTGNITRQLLPFVDLLIGIEPNIACMTYIEENYHSHKNLVLINKLIQEVSINDINNLIIDTIICINVLEHIEDDQFVMNKFFQLLPTNSRVVFIYSSCSICIWSNRFCCWTFP